MPSFISAIYAPCKDLFLYFKGKRQDIKDLEGKLTTLVTDLISIKSRKRLIEESLRTSVTKKKTSEYTVVEAEIEGILKKFTKFTSKYAKITGKLPAPTGELNDLVARDMIEKLYEIKPKTLTVNFFKLADLSRDIAKLSTRASACLARVDAKHLMHKDSESYAQKLNDESGNGLPVLNKYVDEVMRHLSAGNYGTRVGISGPVGVGKTTVMTRLHNRLMDTESLSNRDSSSRLNIIWIPVQMTVEKLQNEIMLQLQIFHEKTESNHFNASNISKFLCQKEYILLIDQVSGYIDLNTLGIQRDHEYGSVVIASGDKKVVNLMTDSEVEIQRLEKEYAFELFESIHGKINDERLEGIANKIVECCGGLAREIRFVAAYLKNKKEESSWMNVKNNLQSNTKFIELLSLGGLDYFYKKRYDELELSSKKCFLFTALFPNEHIIFKDYLIECWMAERFIDEDDVQKLRRTRDSGQTILDQLTDIYLLDWCLEGKYVKMPPNCRRVAVEQNYPDDENCLIWMPSDDRRLDEETWNTVKRMSLIFCETKLPESPNCPNIHTLLLRSMPELNNLADSFFLHMEKLHVLDLYQTDIVKLPSSVKELTSLRSLCLNRCKHLEMLPPEAAQLTSLEFLDICGTSIPSLPLEIGNMIDLRCLRAAFSPKGEDLHEIIIPLEIIKNLEKLEELSINAGLYSPPSEIAQELAIELAGLKYLTTLHFNFPNFSTFNTFITRSESFNNKKTSWGSDTFRFFRIFVGPEIQHSYESDVSKLLAERRLRFSGDEGFSSASSKELLQQTCAFELMDNQMVETLSRYNLRSVKVCVVGHCNNLKNIVDGYTINATQGIVEESSIGVFKDLEKLHLYDLQLLECVWKRTSIPQCLDRLTVLTLKDCPKLTRILDRALPSLKHLKVENCCQISQIVEVPNESSSSEPVDMVNSVLSVELINLPCLHSICSNHSLSWNSLDSLVIRGCSKLSNLSLTETNAQRTTSITCERSWWDQLQLANGVKERLHPFFSFEKHPDRKTSNGIRLEDLADTGEERAEQKVCCGKQCLAVDEGFREVKIHIQASA